MAKAERTTSEDAPASEAEANGANGAKVEGSKAGKKKSRSRDRADGEIVAALEHARWRHFGWGLFGLVIGGLFVVVLGTVGKVVGVVLLVVAVLAGRNFAKTLLHAPGSIRVGAETLTVPVGLCRGDEREYPYDGVRHAFFLRRAVPWTRAGPILIIEAEDAAYSYPRDWFASESDQKRVVEAINRRLGRG